MNVDKAERICNQLLIESLLRKKLNSDSVNEIVDLPRLNKPICFRGKNSDGIISIISELSGIIREYIGDEIVSCFHSDNNRVKSDLLINDQKFVEIKLGNATSAAIGLNVAKSIFGVNLLDKTLKQQREQWVEYQDYESQEKTYNTHMSERFNEIERLGVVDNTTLNNLLNWNNVSANMEEQSNDEVLSIGFKNNNWVTEIITPKILEWERTRCEYNPATNRITAEFESIMGDKIKFVSNQKNRYTNAKMREKGIEKADTRMGLGSLSFNVWVSRV